MILLCFYLFVLVVSMAYTILHVHARQLVLAALHSLVLCELNAILYKTIF